MEFKPKIDKVIARYKAFWEFGDVDDRPVVQIQIPSSLDAREAMYGASFDKILDYYERLFQERIELSDDTIPIISTFSYFGHTLLPSIMGSPVLVRGGSIWSEPILDNLQDVIGLRPDWECDNYQRFQDFYRYFSEKASGRFCVAQHLAKSPGELMSSLRGPEKLIFDFYDQPKLVKEFGQMCLRFSLEYSKRILTDVELTEIERGQVYCYANWVPKDTACFSEDFTANWSPKIYNEFIKPLDESFISSFSVSNMEWHSGCSHIFSEIPPVDAIEFNLDPVHAGIGEVFDDLTAYIGKSKFLLPCKKEDIKKVIDVFGVRGLMIVTACNSVKEGNQLLEDIAEWTDKYKRKHLA